MHATHLSSASLADGNGRSIGATFSGVEGRDALGPVGGLTAGSRDFSVCPTDGEDVDLGSAG